jgi:asparagine synthase (glutamine-hydrolysing)
MSGLCGFLGSGDPAWLSRLLEPIEYRGDASQVLSGPGHGLGIRYVADRSRRGDARSGEAIYGGAAIHQDPDGVLLALAGRIMPGPAEPAAHVDALYRQGRVGELDGDFAAARIDPARQELTLVRDPFGIRSLFYVRHEGALWFASELKQLLALPGLPVELEPSALHKYLTFSFVPGEVTPIRGVRSVLPGHLLSSRAGSLTSSRWFQLDEAEDPALADGAVAARRLREQCRRSIRAHLGTVPRAGVYLSGGIDSSGVAAFLARSGASIRALSLDFGAASVEHEQAEQVARHLGIELEWVPASGREILPSFEDLVWKLDLPFGDVVTGPQYLLGRAARRAGLAHVFNGEGGDQFFGGWTTKPMLAAAVYGGMFGAETPEEQYLRSYHRFYGLEDQLYTAELRQAVGEPGQRRALLAPYLSGGAMHGFLNRVRLTDVALKGSGNILPRAERIASGFGLELHMPLFDRALAELSFRIPPSLKLHGACEKYVLKRALSRALPEEVVWRRKYGMSVPITDWLLGPKGQVAPAELAPLLDELLGPDSLRRRGLFQPDYVAHLRAGEDQPIETRRRRLGEKLWALLMLEAWLRRFVDARGRAP